MNKNLTQIRLAVDKIEAHLFDENLDLDAITAALGYSKYHWHRMFTAMTGISVHRYIQRRRISEAARRLIGTTDPILTIALDCGYQTQRSFARQFKAFLSVQSTDLSAAKSVFAIAGNRRAERATAGSAAEF